ncbi:Hypothetical protein GbCGDNIH5_1630a [Granulibacter bethesdensis]|nr:Hypothetical protein GbCGDNIH5_1630a [Granulibacter bethesdensis]
MYVARVYLRARGGTSVFYDPRGSTEGLSPRTRRNPARYGNRPSADGSISAHAEEPLPRATRFCRNRVYLRARGGTITRADGVTQASGLSPRTRRNLFRFAFRKFPLGSISAHAEEPPKNAENHCPNKVYLRARGGTLRDQWLKNFDEGLSPRTRRNPVGSLRVSVYKRSISAHAEEPPTPSPGLKSDWVYLRARGGTKTMTLSEIFNQGLSPRTRRNPGANAPTAVCERSISAHAEEPSGGDVNLSSMTVYLRARGGTAVRATPVPAGEGLSPRTRRNLYAITAGHAVSRSISAHAEEPVSQKSRGQFCGVYLRARGGTSCLQHIDTY